MSPIAKQTSNSRRGISLVEVLISLTMMLLLSIITVQGMILHGRMAQSNLTRERLAENSRRMMDSISVFALDATIIRVGSGPAGANTVLTLGKPNPDDLTTILYKQFAYLDPDDNPATINDNVIVERSQNSPMSTEGSTLVQYCSPVTGTSIFAKVVGSARPLYAVNLRVGDRSYPSSNADDAITGHGYQSFLINANFSQL